VSKRSFIPFSHNPTKQGNRVHHHTHPKTQNFRRKRLAMPPGSNGVAPSQNRRPPASHPPTSDVEVPYPNGGIAQVNSNDYDGPVDLDELFTSSRNQIDRRDADEDSLFDDDDEDDTELQGPQLKYFNNPHKRLLDNDASLIPGSPFSKPAMKRSNRPTEPLAMAKVRSAM
jgi:hypothetical protein